MWLSAPPELTKS
jgi:hypothetical protein